VPSWSKARTISDVSSTSSARMGTISMNWPETEPEAHASANSLMRALLCSGSLQLGSGR